MPAAAPAVSDRAQRPRIWPSGGSIVWCTEVAALRQPAAAGSFRFDPRKFQHDAGSADVVKGSSRASSGARHPEMRSPLVVAPAVRSA